MMGFVKDWLAGTLTRKFTLLMVAFLALQSAQLGIGIFALLHIGEESRLINEAGKQRMRLAMLQLLVHRAAEGDWGPADREQLAFLSALQDRAFASLGRHASKPLHGQLLLSHSAARAHWEDKIKPTLTAARMADAASARAVKALLATEVPVQLAHADHVTEQIQRNTSRDSHALAVFQASALLLSLLLGVAGLIMARHIVSQPLRKLTEASNAIADGAYDKRVAVSSRDELGRLARTFNRMAAAVGEKAERIAALNQVAIRLTSVQSVYELQAEIMRQGMELSGAQAAAIALFDGQALRLEDWVTEGLPAHVAPLVRAKAPALAEAAFRAGRSLASEDPASASAREGGIARLLCVPLASHADRQGVLYLVCRDRDGFQPAEVELLDTFARLAASAIENLRQRNQLQDLARTDKLTGLRNRRFFEERLANESARARRYPRPLALLLLDIDDFKRINDARGHAAGDRVLESLGRILAAQSRGTDVAARYGGEEFVLLLPETDVARARMVGERVRRQVADTPVALPEGEPAHVTVSVGIACFPAGGDGADHLVEQADQALYAAKRAGKDRVCLYGEPPALG